MPRTGARFAKFASGELTPEVCVKFTRPSALKYAPSFVRGKKVSNIVYTDRSVAVALDCWHEPAKVHAHRYLRLASALLAAEEEGWLAPGFWDQFRPENLTITSLGYNGLMQRLRALQTTKEAEPFFSSASHS